MSHSLTPESKLQRQGEKQPEEARLEDALQASSSRSITYCRDDKPSPHPILTAQEEKRLWRKVDCRFLPIVILLYLCSFLDRSNIGE